MGLETHFVATAAESGGTTLVVWCLVMRLGLATNLDKSAIEGDTAMKISHDAAMWGVIVLGCVSWAILIANAAAAPAAQDSAKPNVIVIVADDREAERVLQSIRPRKTRQNLQFATADGCSHTATNSAKSRRINYIRLHAPLE
jgi:hypothetical protein